MGAAAALWARDMQHSRAITRQSASNLALAFVLLPRPKREAMSALYAFCREVDDIADDESVALEARKELLRGWREDIRRAYATETPRYPVNRELQPIIHQYQLRLEEFEALLDGVEMDLTINRYPNYTELDLYCYRVASVVGLLSIPIFGYSDPGCRDYAVHLGKALQYTNILRDVHADAARSRIYLPLSELARFQVDSEEILQGQYSERYASLAGSVAERARGFYRLAHESLPAVDRRAMAAAELMASVYWRLLEKLQHQHFNVFGRNPARISKGHKLWLVLCAWIRLAAGSASAGYGT